MRLEEMENNHHQRGHATQAVQYLVVRLRGEVGGLCFHKNILFVLIMAAKIRQKNYFCAQELKRIE